MIPDELVPLPVVKEYFLVFESVTKVREAMRLGVFMFTFQIAR